MVEAEIGFSGLKDCIDLAEDYLKHCVRYALLHCSDELQFLSDCEGGEVGLLERLQNVLENPFQVSSGLFETYCCKPMLLALSCY